MKRLVIRADAGRLIGTGHVMRCLSLAQAWQDAGGEAMYVSADLTPTLAERFQSESIGVHYLQQSPGSPQDASETVALAQQYEADLVVADGYRFGSDFQRTIKAAGLRLLAVDDYGQADHYYADFVLNQTNTGNEAMYASREPYTQLLLGTRYVMFRREFRRWFDWQRKIPSQAKRLLITLGGSDPDNVTAKVIRSLQRIPASDLEVKVVVGGGNPHFETIKSLLGNCVFSAELHRNASNMPELIAWCDVAVVAGGSTIWELALLATPALTIILATNQEQPVRQLAQSGAVIDLGWHHQLNDEQLASQLQKFLADERLRSATSRKLHDMVDGRGVQRVLQAVAATLPNTHL